LGEYAREVTEAATIHFDGGGQSPGPVIAACIVELSDGSVVQAVRCFGQGTHNIAEWHALILGLRLALDHGARRVVVEGDSELVVNQVNDKSQTKHPNLLPLRAEAKELLAEFESWSVKWIGREKNRRADELGRGVMSLGLCAPTVDP
jgi:ribonuclease HI